MSVATSTAVAIGIAAGTAGGTALAAHAQAGAAREAAATGAASADRSAELQSQSAREALDFEKQKDAEATAAAERTQRANYKQYVARETRINDIRSELGMNVRPILAYDDVYGGAPTAGAPTTGAPTTGAVTTAQPTGPRYVAAQPGLAQAAYQTLSATEPLYRPPNTIRGILSDSASGDYSARRL